MGVVRGLLRLVTIALAAASPSPAGLARAEAAPPAAASHTAGGIAALAADLWPEAQTRGIARATFDSALKGLVPDPSVAAMTQRQPEFVKPIGAYLAAQVTAGRIAAGQVMLARWSHDLEAIERRYEVPRAIIIAVWGMETGYGAASAGPKDVIRSLATLAAMNYRPALYRAELLAALAMLQDGDARRPELRGSWAGAMGLPQFMPSSYRTFAVDWDGDGRRDIWTSVPDALASIANFIRSQGWTPGRPWGFEVKVPTGFDGRVSRASGPEWEARGVMRVGGAPLSAAGELTLFYPAGSAGPAFLVTPNFEVLKTYNFSDAYVLSVGQLADRMEGGGAIAASWPGDRPMSRDERIALQARLVTLGYAVDNREGRISLALRDVIRSAQRNVALVPDGNPTLRLLQALRARPDPP